MDDLQLVKKYQKEIILLKRAEALLAWDQRTYMPSKGISGRAEQISFLEGLVHEMTVNNKLYSALKRLKKRKNIFGDDKIMINKLLKYVSKKRRLPKEFIEKLTKTTSLAESAWIEARKKNNFKIFEPHLKKIVELKKQQARYIHLKGHPYNSLLDEFEEGMTVEKLKPVFRKLKNDLLNLISNIKKSKEYKNQKQVILKKNFPRDVQMDFVRDVIKRMGLEEDNSRIDFSEHPFTTDIDLKDVRMTTNIRKYPLFSFVASMHEAGHGLYMLGYPEKHKYDLLGDASSIGMHESQSRFWELMIGSGKPFWKFYFPKFNEKYHLNTNFDRFYKEINFITPSKIRISSNEIYYNLHILLRFEFEIGLIEGTIKVKDLHRLWNQKMREYIGIAPKNDVEGVLQDIQWSMGYFGYFPTYTLGTIYAAQLYAAMKKLMPSIEKDISKGDFKRIRKWLKENIHQQGARMLTDDIIKKVCGKGLNPDSFINYLNDKYSKIYKF